VSCKEEKEEQRRIGKKKKVEAAQRERYSLFPRSKKPDVREGKSDPSQSNKKKAAIDPLCLESRTQKNLSKQQKEKLPLRQEGPILTKKREGGGAFQERDGKRLLLAPCVRKSMTGKRGRKTFLQCARKTGIRINDMKLHPYKTEEGKRGGQRAVLSRWEGKGGGAGRKRKKKKSRT